MSGCTDFIDVVDPIELSILEAIRDGNLQLIKSIALSHPKLLKYGKYRGDDYFFIMSSSGKYPFDSEMWRFFYSLYEIERSVLNAVCEDNLAYIQSIAKDDPDLLFREEIGGSLLHYAASKGRDRICEFLIKLGFDVNHHGITVGRAGSDHGSPLMAAARPGHVSTVQLLLAHGAYVDEPAERETTALMSAAIKNECEIIKILLAEGAEVNREMPIMHFTALDYALTFGNDEAAEILRAHGGVSFQNEKTDWSSAPDQSFVEALELEVGPVYPFSCGHIVSDEIDFALRFVRVAPKMAQKLVVTSGLVDFVGYELGICVQREWPFNDKSALNPALDWPLRALFVMGGLAATGYEVKHGSVLSSEHPAFDQCSLPVGHVLVAAQLIEQENSQLPHILLLHAIKQTQKSSKAEWGIGIADKQSKKRWSSIMHKLPKLIASNSFT